MRFAIINNERTEAKYGLKGICPICQEMVYAKCGDIRAHHWSHRAERKCDSRWESQTEWHRAWKNKYPIEWQEKYQIENETKELHIADVLTAHNLVLEFQHSHIQSAERESRERFYTNLVWVVNGRRLKYMYSRFEKGFEHYMTREPYVFQIYNIEKYLPIEWLNSKVPVVFDFNGYDVSDNQDNIKSYLYCLLPKTLGRYRVLIKLTKKAFIRSTNDGDWQNRVNIYLKRILSEEAEEEKMRRQYGGDTQFNEERKQYYDSL